MDDKKSHRAIRKELIEADREMPSDQMRTTNRVPCSSSFALHPSNFAPALPGQLFGKLGMN